MEAISGYFATIGSREALGYVLVTTLEEAGEMSGVAVLLHALLCHTGTGARAAPWARSAPRTVHARLLHGRMR